MHMCPNRVSNLYPSTPSITPSANQSSTLRPQHAPCAQPRPLTSPIHLPPLLLSPCSQKAHTPIPAQPQHARCTVTPIRYPRHARSPARWRRAAYADHSNQTRRPSARSPNPVRRNKNSTRCFEINTQTRRRDEVRKLERGAAEELPIGGGGSDRCESVSSSDERVGWCRIQTSWGCVRRCVALRCVEWTRGRETMWSYAYAVSYPPAVRKKQSM
jgi:hypothetical protein